MTKGMISQSCISINGKSIHHKSGVQAFLTTCEFGHVVYSLYISGFHV